ncbi:hypothetical protein C8R46DRAFT_1035900 [Mycena filopes]|nr:hypothetical protein C8R46DRAFT_1035900 [Mycena filopes]
MNSSGFANIFGPATAIPINVSAMSECSLDDRITVQETSPERLRLKTAIYDLETIMKYELTRAYQQNDYWTGAREHLLEFQACHYLQQSNDDYDPSLVERIDRYIWQNTKDVEILQSIHLPALRVPQVLPWSSDQTSDIQPYITAGTVPRNSAPGPVNLHGQPDFDPTRRPVSRNLTGPEPEPAPTAESYRGGPQRMEDQAPPRMEEDTIMPRSLANEVNKMVRITTQQLLGIRLDHLVSSTVQTKQFATLEEAELFATGTVGGPQPGLDPFRPCWDDLEGRWNLALEGYFTRYFTTKYPRFRAHEIHGQHRNPHTTIIIESNDADLYKKRVHISPSNLKRTDNPRTTLNYSMNGKRGYSATIRSLNRKEAPSRERKTNGHGHGHTSTVWNDDRVLKSSVVGGAKFGICYNHGKVQLETLDDPPEPLRRLPTTLWGIFSHSIAVCGVASNINHDDATFELGAEQHISATRSPSESFVVRYLIQDTARSKKYQPIPSNGKRYSPRFLTSLERKEDKTVKHFIIELETVNFVGRSGSSALKAEESLSKIFKAVLASKKRKTADDKVAEEAQEDKGKGSLNGRSRHVGSNLPAPGTPPRRLELRRNVLTANATFWAIERRVTSATARSSRKSTGNYLEDPASACPALMRHDRVVGTVEDCVMLEYSVWGYGGSRDHRARGDKHNPRDVQPKEYNYFVFKIVTWAVKYLLLSLRSGDSLPLSFKALKRDASPGGRSHPSKARRVLEAQLIRGSKRQGRRHASSGDYLSAKDRSNLSRLILFDLGDGEDFLLIHGNPNLRAGAVDVSCASSTPRVARSDKIQSKLCRQSRIFSGRAKLLIEKRMAPPSESVTGMENQDAHASAWALAAEHPTSESSGTSRTGQKDGSNAARREGRDETTRQSSA